MATPIYWQVGIGLADAITYQNSAGTFIIGKVQANFTIIVSTSAGVVASPGITLTEVSAGSDPGVYSIAYSGTGMLATLGSYHVLIYDTSAPLNSWDADIVVTASGGPSPVGSVAFTSTSGNGRAVDGSGNPLANVSIILRNAATGVYQVSLTTGSDGNWGPLYLPVGTYNIYYQLSGYSQGIASVVYISATVVGPGSDITLTAIVTTATLLASDAWTYARQQSYDQVGPSADLKLKRSVNRAAEMVAKERKFNWWLRRASLPINGALNYTVTLTKGSTLVTSTSGNFPTWTNLGRLRLNNQVLDLTTNPTTTTATMSGIWNGASGSYSATLFQDSYALPANMFQFGRILPGQTWGWGGEPVSIEQIWEWQNALAYAQQGPSAFAIANNMLTLYPYPSVDASYMVTFHARPAPVAVATDIIDFDPCQIEILHRAIDYQVAVEFGKSVHGEAAECLAGYTQALARMVTTDRSIADLPSLSQRRGQAPFWRAPRAP